MNAQKLLPFIDTTIIPDRNAGIGSLLLDLQYSRYPDSDGPPLLGSEFAFIDVGISHARVSTSLRTLLAKDLGMKVVYVATELRDMVPYAYITPTGDRAEKVHSYLSGMISPGATMRQVTDWHYVLDRRGKVYSIAYSYDHYGNEVWESYFLGRPFLMSGEKVEFRNPELDEMLVSDIQDIEARIKLEMKRDNDPGQPGASWDGYRLEKDPLAKGLAEFGITLQELDVPQRISGRQNVLFLGNVVNNYPHDEQVKELNRIAANMLEGDLIIVQADENEASYVEVLLVKGQGARKRNERVRWINTITLEVGMPAPGKGSWKTIHLKPLMVQITYMFIDCLGRKISSPEWNQEEHKLVIRQYIYQFFAKFFRALPSDETLRIAFRTILRRFPYVDKLRGVPVFRNDADDALGGELSDLSPIISEEDIESMKVAIAKVAG